MKLSALHICRTYCHFDPKLSFTSILVWLEANAVRSRGTGNADVHLKRTIMGREVVVAVTAGKLDFGPWEQIFYGEFDGRRRKRVLVKIVGA
jgi:secondary thiamine-phosphate synthase enzyme